MDSQYLEQKRQNNLHGEKMQCLTHKFELELLKMVKETLAINEKNGNTLWKNAIQK